MGQWRFSHESILSRERWTQLIAGIICMIMIANLEYGWTLFVHPMAKAHGWSIAGIQFAFAIFVALETWLTPVEGWIVDYLGPQRGPKLMVAFGGIMIAAGWIVNSKADTLTMLDVGAALSGIGGGAVYATCVGQAVKWFPDRRGLAVGHGGRLRRRRGADRGADPRRDCRRRLPGGVLPVRPWARRDRPHAWLLRAPQADEAKAMSMMAPPKVMQSSKSYRWARCSRRRCFGCSTWSCSCPQAA